MIIKPNLAGFYDKSEVEFLGREINFAFMTPAQLDKAIIESAALYNQLYPPKQKSGFDKFMRKAVPVVIMGGAVAVTGGAILASYGIGMGTALGTVSTAVTASAGTGSVLASVQGAASAVAAGGLLYGKVTGETPEDLVKVAEMVKSENALDAMQLVANEELAKKGAAIQAEDAESQAALRERLRKEQQILSDKMLLAADQKAQTLGQETPQKKKVGGLEIAALATPFILFFMR